MKFINSKIHGVLDYVMVASLLVSPNLFDLPEFTSNCTYILAGVHFVLTALTRFEFGLFKIISFEVHGIVELVVSVVLVVVGLMLGIIDNDTARNFYLFLAVVVFVTWLFTNYRSARKY